MILPFFFLFLMLLVISGALFYLFCFFLPALRLKYDGICDSLATKPVFPEIPGSHVRPDFSKTAALEETDENDLERLPLSRGHGSCSLFHRIYGSGQREPKVCFGFGDCVGSCPQEAIFVRDNHARISRMCNGCGECVGSCPERIISLVPRAKKSGEIEEKDFKFWSACYRLLSVVRR